MAHKNAIYDSTTRSITMPYSNNELLHHLHGATEQAAECCRVSESPTLFDFSQLSLDNPAIVDNAEFQAAVAAGIPAETVIHLISIRLGGAHINHKYGR